VRTRLVQGLCAGVAPESTATTLLELREAGVTIG
jgi:hypothetical protein